MTRLLVCLELRNFPDTGLPCAKPGEVLGNLWRLVILDHRLHSLVTVACFLMTIGEGR